jgi:hypothetical protein
MVNMKKSKKNWKQGGQIGNKEAWSKTDRESGMVVHACDPIYSGSRGIIAVQGQPRQK